MAIKTKSKVNVSSFGKIISVSGSVVDVWFDNDLPAIYSLLRTGKNNEIALEVLTQIDENRVRGIALTPTQGLSRGMTAVSDGKQRTVPEGITSPR